MGSPDRSSRWSDRFRARMDAAAATPAASPRELYRRELDALTVLVWIGVFGTVLITLAVLVGGVPWWTPLLMVLVTLGSIRRRRLARRRGEP